MTRFKFKPRLVTNQDKFNTIRDEIKDDLQCFIKYWSTDRGFNMLFFIATCFLIGSVALLITHIIMLPFYFLEKLITK